MKRHYDWVDIAKGIAMICIVAMHSRVGVFSWIVDQTNYFHVPLFFFISGVFLNTNKIAKDVIMARWNRLIKPYYIYGGLIAIFSYSTGLNPYFIFDNFLIGIRCGAIWFLPSLFFASIIVWFIAKYVSLRISLAILVVGIVISHFLVCRNIQLPFNMDLTLYMMPFLYMGKALALRVLQYNQYTKEKCIWAGVVWGG